MKGGANEYSKVTDLLSLSSINGSSNVLYPWYSRMLQGLTYPKSAVNFLSWNLSRLVAQFEFPSLSHPHNGSKWEKNVVGEHFLGPFSSSLINTSLRLVLAHLSRWLISEHRLLKFMHLFSVDSMLTVALRPVPIAMSKTRPSHHCLNTDPIALALEVK